MADWSLQDAKNRFSAVVDAAVVTQARPVRLQLQPPSAPWPPSLLDARRHPNVRRSGLAVRGHQKSEGVEEGLAVLVHALLPPRGALVIDERQHPAQRTRPRRRATGTRGLPGACVEPPPDDGRCRARCPKTGRRGRPPCFLAIVQEESVPSGRGIDARTGPILAFLGITGTVLVGVVPNFYLAFTSPISAWTARRVLLPASNFASTFFSNSPILLVIPSCASLFSVRASSTFLLILPSLRLTTKLTIHAMNPKKPTVTPTTVAISVKVIPRAVCAGTGTGTITSVLSGPVQTEP